MLETLLGAVLAVFGVVVLMRKIASSVFPILLDRHPLRCDVCSAWWPSLALGLLLYFRAADVLSSALVIFSCTGGATILLKWYSKLTGYTEDASWSMLPIEDIEPIPEPVEVKTEKSFNDR